MFSEVDHTTAIRTVRHKYVMDSEGAGLMLHDLADDPQERTSLVGHPGARSIEQELRDQLLRWLARTQVRQK